MTENSTHSSLATDDTSSESSILTDQDKFPNQLPYAYARRHGVVIIKDETEQTLWLLHKPGVSLSVLSEVRRLFSQPLIYSEVDQEILEKQLTLIYETGSKQSSQIINDIDLDHAARALNQPEDLLGSNDNSPIIQLINALFTEAIKEEASDIHIEPYENRLVVRFRVDGLLREVLTAPRNIALFLVSRIKVMAQLDIAEKRIPQDGRISLKVGNRPVDVRVSTLPSNHGERVVLRLLDKQAGRLDLEQLGMSKKLLMQVDPGVIKCPHGIFLVTGPTGSGKTTTLYAALSRLNTQTRNIVTVEDPVEYYLDGIGQTQINNKVGLTFARGLRAILRQDPDVLMVGEIRDLDTAQIAIQASLTGHLVMSTLHTNTAIGTITRLRDMGVESFLLSSSLIGILAQRLVRTLCPHCKAPYTANDEEKALLELPSADEVTFYTSVGCEKCNNHGYQGRTGIYELISIDETLRNLIHKDSGEMEMLEHARHSTDSLRQDGIKRALKGDTSIAEIIRVALEH
ncbi:MAG: type II secretion system ATPase GspE [Candidatus Thiodiazotropha sp. (ex Lucinoma aequizonata)]|nr:type II secretion system ATPase GspE [Candidatus Thiodiazotropha sp. (ex Lucinoma aequizonata)]MCU7887817.1 type II secretion system ATPase GspE [Candidatus Thiodiazotropha sp. (ex Lucinoma aequizonata)]MCU7895550.1 type II secretion system ATPase GspE [Candidatus Thiodiazotropha sp. (ex Lucinoma aequizonata)]MCU7899065.1 type II secretion system ATPase GspE [Candidatus Thiodiazotropha sp. (ex Lucinoma aequizonata)]MCU7903259.1 type II secretion system ATPase GspE [Candidatus Thiodiazotropha